MRVFGIQSPDPLASAQLYGAGSLTWGVLILVIAEVSSGVIRGFLPVKLNGTEQIVIDSRRKGLTKEAGHL